MKKTIATLIITAATLFSTANLNAQEATINTAESSIHWLAKKVAGQHEGNINLVSGSLMMNDGILTGGSFVVDMTSLNTTDLQGNSKQKLEGHLKSNDFFGVATYPQAKLVFNSRHYIRRKCKDKGYLC